MRRVCGAVERVKWCRVKGGSMGMTFRGQNKLGLLKLEMSNCGGGNANVDASEPPEMRLPK